MAGQSICTSSLHCLHHTLFTHILYYSCCSQRGYSHLADATVDGGYKLGQWGNLASSGAAGAGGAAAAAAGTSLLTLDLPSAPLAELANVSLSLPNYCLHVHTTLTLFPLRLLQVMDLYQSLFGVTPDVSIHT
jgi:hypothetical protein